MTLSLKILRVLNQRDAVKTELCEDEHGKRVVLKTLSVAASDLESLKLFEREGQTLENLSHPRVPRYLGSWTEEKAGGVELKIAQEFIEGQTLAALIAGGKRFNATEAYDIARQACEVLAFLHALHPPVVHRDLKASNVIIDPHGRVHIIDFGAVTTPKSEGNTVVGTFGYMPPEQFEGRATPASDIYALGVVIITLLTHKEPWEIPGGPSKALANINIDGRFKRALAAFIGLDANTRPQNGSAALARLLHDDTRAPQARVHVDSPEQMRERSQKGAMAFALIAAVVMLLGGVGLALFFTTGRVISTDPTPDPVTESVQPLTAKPAIATAFRSKYTHPLYLAFDCAQKLERIGSSAKRYRSWVSASGPTCKERYISYGVYTAFDSATKTCKDAALAVPALASELEAMRDLNERALPILHKASLYFDDEYHDDDCAFGKSNHPVMMEIYNDSDALSLKTLQALDLHFADELYYQEMPAAVAPVFKNALALLKIVPMQKPTNKKKQKLLHIAAPKNADKIYVAYRELSDAVKKANAEMVPRDQRTIAALTEWVQKNAKDMRTLSRGKSISRIFGKTHDPYGLRFPLYDAIVSGLVQ